jgi:hypothetical protein
MATAGGGLLSALTWEVPPLLTQCLDNVTAAATKRGYAFTLSSVAPLRPPLPMDGAGNLLVRPNAAALNLTIALPLAPTFVTTSLTPLVPWTQLLANIVGLSGVLSVVGVLFGFAEKRLMRNGGRRGPLASATGSAAGDVHSQLARIGALVRLANEQAAEAAIETAKATKLSAEATALVAEALRMARSLGGFLPAGGELPAVENPLLHAGRAAPAIQDLLAGTTLGVASPLAVVWRRYSDTKDVWFVSSAGQTEWELPEGAVLASWESCEGGDGASVTRRS